MNGYAEATPENYAMYKVTDTMFLLSGHQAYHMWQNLGTVAAEQTSKAAEVSAGLNFPIFPVRQKRFRTIRFAIGRGEPSAASGVVSLHGEKNVITLVQAQMR